MRSWRKTTNVLLISIILLATAILVWTNIYYNRQIRNAILEENADAVSRWAQYVSTSLDAAYGHVFELMVTIYGNTELRSGSEMMRALARNNIVKTMSDKLISNENIDCLFVLDTDTDMLLFSSNSALPYQESYMLKTGIRELTESITTGINSRWMMGELNGKAYFVKSISLGKYRVGAACRVEAFAITKNFSIRGDDTSFLLFYGERAYFVDGDTDRSDEVEIDSEGTPHLPRNLTVISLDMNQVSATALLAAETHGFFHSEDALSAVLLIAVSVIFIALILAFDRMMRRKIASPTQELLNATREISTGNIHYRITAQSGSEEFEYLFDSFNNMARQIHNLRIESYDRLLADRENRLRLLRAQIKPHFYLNAVTTISNMTYQGRSEDIRNFCAALAKYMRYMLNVQSEWTTIGEELAHIMNYVKMQRYRSAGDLAFEIDCPVEVGRVRIPLLVMFTVVENTFKHGMSVENHLAVRICGVRADTPDFSGYIITIEDNGDGFPEHIVETMNAPLEEALPAKEHLGLSNVRYTMALLYGRQGLLRLSNRENGGARVEIRIPDEEGGTK